MNLLSFISSKIKINHYLCSHDGSLSVPLPFEPEKKRLTDPFAPAHLQHLEENAFRRYFFHLFTQQVFSVICLCLPLHPPPPLSLCTVWRDLHVALVYGMPWALRKLKLYHHFVIIPFSATEKKILRSLQSWFTVCWIIHCPFVKEDTPLGWDQLRSSGHKDVTSLSVIHCPFVKEDWGALRSLLRCATHGLAQHLHRLHNGMWGKRRGIGVLATVVVGTVCLLWLTSAEESVDETVERGD